MTTSIQWWGDSHTYPPSSHPFSISSVDSGNCGTEQAIERSITISTAAREDFSLDEKRHYQLHSKDVSMNLLTYRLSTHVYHSDACPAGLGGYSNSDRAWRFPDTTAPPVPIHAEFFRMGSLPKWTHDRLGGKSLLLKLSCFLSMTISTAAAG